MSKLWIENDTTPPAVAWQEESPAGSYTDKTSDLEAWNDYWKHTGKDYLFAKAQMVVIVDAAGGFGSLTTPHKWIAFEHQIGDIDDWQTLVGVDTAMLVQFDLRYTSRMAGSLTLRMAYAKACLKSHFHLDDLHSMLSTIHAEIMNFVTFGVIGKPDHNIDGVKDYLMSTNKFSGAGFMEETWVLKGLLTRLQVRDGVYAIIVDGDY